MSVRVSIVIPSLNEEKWIEASVRSALEAGASEVLVTDGGSSDATLQLARSSGASIVEGAGMRARQMNAGFEETRGDIVCFLHADTRLPTDACQAMVSSIAAGAEFGGFRLRFAEGGPRLALAAFMINTRTALLRTPWGDQAQFFSRDAFMDAGRYPEIPIMEDYEMARSMKRRSRPALLASKVTTSGRRFLELGLLKTALLNWRIIIAWHRGASPADLRRIYGSR